MKIKTILINYIITGIFTLVVLVLDTLLCVFGFDSWSFTNFQLLLIFILTWLLLNQLKLTEEAE